MATARGNNNGATRNVSGKLSDRQPPAPSGEEIVEFDDAPVGEEIDGGDVDEILTLAPGDRVEGEYRGYKETRGKNVGDVNRLHKVIIAGVPSGIWGTNQLNAMLEKCKTGDTVWIGYKGKSVLQNGNDFHNWKVVVTARKGAVPF